MGKNWSIKVWIALLVNVLLLMTTLFLSLFFYREFEKSLNERVLLQLTSIKRLKRIQVEDYLERKWEEFESGRLEGELLIESELVSKLHTRLDTVQQVYDLTAQNPTGTLKLAMVLTEGKEKYRVAFLDDREVQRILLERTGMGQSGESYIVGSDFKLRTKSRFLPDKMPYEIQCETEGVRLAFQNGEGRKLINDYRGIPVFSAFHTLKFKNLDWVMLSEIDEEEALRPLYNLQFKLILIFLTVLFLGFVAAMMITSFLSSPINRMKNYLSEMSNGNYDFNIDDTLTGKELIEMYQAFKETVNATRSSISFSNEIGNMRLDEPYTPYGENDILGQSLILMRDKLKAFTTKEESRQLAIRKALIEGEENERQRLSAELHDGIGPMLTSLKLLVENKSKGNEVALKKLIDEIILEVRRITFNLLPSSLLDFGLKNALFNYIQMVQNLSKADISYTYHEAEGTELSKQVKISIFRLVQEALNNTVKHAQAENITLVITEEDSLVDFYYSDDGKGFDLKTIKRKSGLSNMQARVESLSGSFNLQSNEAGTTIQANIPK